MEGESAERNIFVREPPELYALAAKWIRGAINNGINRGHCAIALSGGSTPGPVYELLAKPPLSEQVDWSKVDLYFADERCVAPGHAQSNYAMIRRTLLSQVPIPAEQVHRIEAERSDVMEAVSAYGRILPAELDVLVLGVGADGHTASIFPGSEAEREMRRRVVWVEKSPKPPPCRVTITPPVIGTARQIVVIATGAEKAQVVARTLDGPETPLEFPIQLAKRGAWFLDSAAAALLKKG